MKKLLILGGTQFIGRNLVGRLLNSPDYEVTIFNRQHTNPELFPGINRIAGDRETDDIAQIEHVAWDYVIDLSCFYPDALSKTLTCLATPPDKYILISTCSAYDNENNRQILKTEQIPTLPCTDEQRTDRTVKTYGNRKAECERILQASGLNHIILRPALVYGPYDHTDRLYYWLYQVMHNDTLLLPDHGKRRFAVTYVGDLVEAIQKAIANNRTDQVYNAISHPQTSIREIVDTASDMLERKCRMVNASHDFLKLHSINQWTDMPLWIDGNHFTYDNAKLKKELGIEPISFENSIRSTIDYYSRLSWPVPKYGMTEDTRLALFEKLVEENNFGDD